MTAFSAEILYEVYLRGDTGARRCRSIVLLSLMSAVIVTLVCIRQAGTGKIRLFWQRRSTPQRELYSALGLLAFLVLVHLKENGALLSRSVGVCLLSGPLLYVLPWMRADAHPQVHCPP